MSVSMETQRLISVSLGKIAQSRGQRGGINLHKNLLVATVLHKARNAYMIESYSYQQNLQRQKQAEQYQVQQRNVGGEKVVAAPAALANKGVSRDQQDGGPVVAGHEQQNTSDISSDNATHVIDNSEPISNSETEVVQNKENSPPVVDSRLVVPDRNVVSEACTPVDQDGHLIASVQLSQDAQMCELTHKQQSLTTASTTCNVLKRRRDNVDASLHDLDSPVNKIAKVQNDASTYSSLSTYSHDESRSESQIPHTTDSNQILNLVNIFSSGFSGLCAASSSDLHAQSYQNDFDMSSSHQLHARNIAIKAG